ncbi:hypothetical protein V8G54_001468 [Vigna mungo]|uniref:Uncharacterized protein n=1 Tax=Vigna mungo TaxID=3915 RepID=A0AAQ3SBV5_VIGMU
MKRILGKESTNGFVRVHVTVFEGGIDLMFGDVAHYLLQTLNHLPTRRRNPCLMAPTAFAAHPPRSLSDLPPPSPLSSLGFRRDENISARCFSLSLSLDDLHPNGKRTIPN